MSDISPKDLDYHLRTDPHRLGSRLSEIILGGQDGLVNVLGVLLGVAAASGSPRLVVAAGLAATFAESISMAAVAYTSKRAEADLFHSEAARERRHLKAVPALEREEVRELYRRKGFEGPLLERIVDTITANEEVWVAVMMAEEHGLAPISARRALGASLIVGLSAIVGSFIPLVPFFFASIRLAIWISIALAGVVLFAFGALKARWTVGVPWKSGLELTAIGLCSALAGYGIGALFGAPS